MIDVQTDRYNGLIIDSRTLPKSVGEFESELQDIIGKAQGKNLIWVKIPADKSVFVPILTKYGFEFHHCNEQGLMLVKKLISDPIIPTAVNFVIGVGAIVFNNNKLLVVRNRVSTSYKLPGGHIERKEDIKEAVVREVFEETGIKIEFESISCLGHFKRGQFGESVIYIICTARALSDTISIVDKSEIAEARWMDLVSFFSSENVQLFEKKVVRAIIDNNGLKLVARELDFPIHDYEVFF